MEKMSTEDEYQTLLYKKKLMEYQKQKDILRKLLNSDYKFVQEFIDDVPTYALREPLSNLNPSFHGGISTTGSKHNRQQFLLQFMEYMFSNARSFEPSSVRVEESLRTPRRSSHQSPDIIQTLKDILGHATSLERSVSRELSVENTQSSGANGVSSCRRYSSGQRVESHAPPPAAPLPPPAPPAPANAPAPPPPAPAVPPALPSAVSFPHYPPPYLHAPREPATRVPLPPYYHYQ